MKIVSTCGCLAVSTLLIMSACSSDSDNVATGAQGFGAKKPSGGTVTGQATTSNGFDVTFLGSVPNPDGTSTWSYRVDELPCAQDLSNWVLEVFDCPVVGASPERHELVHPDPNAGLNGVKWETGNGFASGTFSVTVSGAARAEAIRFGVKGPDVELGETIGPRCSDAGRPPTGNPGPGSGGKGRRCPDASVPPPVPPGDAAPPPPPNPPTPPSSDAGAPDVPSTCNSGIYCADSPCPTRYICWNSCCQPDIR